MYTMLVRCCDLQKVPQAAHCIYSTSEVGTVNKSKKQIISKLFLQVIFYDCCCSVACHARNQGEFGGFKRTPYHPQRSAVSNSTVHTQTLPRRVAFRDTDNTRVR